MVESARKLVLISQEEERFEVDPAIAQMSILIQNLREDMDDDDCSEPIPLPGVSSKYLALIIEYCQIHNFSKAVTDLVHPLPSKIPSEFINDPRELQFIKRFTEDELIALLSATNFMHVPALFELCCAMIAAELKGKDFNQMKKKYGLDDVNFTPADEEEILRQFPWILAEAQEKIAKLKMDQQPGQAV